MKPLYWKVTTSILAGLSVISYIMMLGAKEEARVSSYALGVSLARVQILEGEIKSFEWNQPREFKSVEHFKGWVKTLGLGLLEANTWERAEKIQDQAFQDGYNVSYNLIVSSVGGGTEWWPVAKIGSEIWCIEPQTNAVTKFYPREWWR